MSSRRRCRACGREQVAGRQKCPSCGSSNIAWSWRARMTAPDGTSKQRRGGVFATKVEADRDEARVRAEVAGGAFVERRALTVAQYLRSWWGSRDYGSGATKVAYRVAIETHCLPYIGGMPLQAVTRVTLKELYQHLLREGLVRRNGAGEIVSRGPLSRKSVTNVHRTLNAAFNEAVKDRLIPTNPATDAWTYNRRKHRKEMLTWSAEEVQTFLSNIADEPLFPLFRLALATGMRRGELLGLRHRDLHLDRLDVDVRRQWTRDGEAGLVFKNLKTGDVGWRTIDVDQVTVEVIQAHVEAQAFQRNRDDYRRDLDLVFCHADGLPYDPDVVSRRFKQLVTAVEGLTKIRFHDMRHTHATLLLEAGESEKTVAERLGDTVEMVNETYAHVTAKMRRRSASTMAGILDGAPRAQNVPSQGHR